MRSLRRSLVAGIAAIVLVGPMMAPREAAAQQRLDFVSTVWPPFTNADGEVRLAVELVNEALARIGIDTETTIVDDARFSASLLDGGFDGSAAVWRDASRERVLLFSEPYLENRLVLVGPRGSDVSARSLDDLAGARIVLVGGYAYGDVVEGARGPVFLRSVSAEDSIGQVLRGDADYTLMDELVVQYIAGRYGQEASATLAFGAVPIVTRTLHLAIRRDIPGAESIIEGFNAELRGMLMDGSYHRLLDVDWIRADVDGDDALEYLPRGERAGPTAPERGYQLFSRPAGDALDLSAPGGFFVGGNLYREWDDVPRRYKIRDPGDLGQERAEPLVLFRYTW